MLLCEILRGFKSQTSLKLISYLSVDDDYVSHLYRAIRYSMHQKAERLVAIQLKRAKNKYELEINENMIQIVIYTTIRSHCTEVNISNPLNDIQGVFLLRRTYLCQ